jgi:hypothetical protein
VREVGDLNFKPESYQQIMRDNAIRIFKLDERSKMKSLRRLSATVRKRTSKAKLAARKPAKKRKAS